MEAETPLTPQMQREIDEATRRLAAIRSTLRIASFNSITLALFGVLTLVINLLSLAMGDRGGVGWIIGAALLALAWNEKRGRDLTLTFDPAGPRRLIANQFILLGVVAAYCLYAMARVDEDIAAVPREAIKLIGKDVLRQATYSTYTAVLLVVACFQLLFAYAYHRMGKRLDLHVAATPDWIRQMQRRQP